MKVIVVLAAISYVSFLLLPAFLYQVLRLPDEVWTPLLNSVLYSTVATFIVLPVAMLLAFYISRRSMGGIMPLLTFSTAIPHTAVGLLLLPLFTRAGIVDTAPAVVVSMVVVSLPIGIGTLVATFTSTQRSLDEVLQPLGLDDFQILWFHVRTSAMGVLTSFLLTWLRSFSELGAFLIVANRPTTVGIHLLELFHKGGAAASVPYAVLLGFIGLLFSTTLFLISRRTSAVV